MLPVTSRGGLARIELLVSGINRICGRVIFRAASFGSDRLHSIVAGFYPRLLVLWAFIYMQTCTAEEQESSIKSQATMMRLWFTMFVGCLIIYGVVW